MTAPVTVRAIFTDTLKWVGLGALVPTAPIPDTPVPDFIAGAWVGVRRFHYTFFNSTPTVTAQTYTKDPETGVIKGSVTSYDADGDAVTYVVAGKPVHGTVAVDADGSYTYTPDAAYAHAGGVDSFTITATDDSLNPFHFDPLTGLVHAVTDALTKIGILRNAAPYWQSATVAVAVGPVNHAPVLSATVGDADPTTGTRVITPTATDPDGDTVTVAVTAGPAHGTLVTNSDGTYTYTPAASFAHTGGSDIITFNATDAYGAIATTSVVFTVTAKNNAPTATNDAFKTNQNTARIITAAQLLGNDSDPDSDPLTVVAVTQPNHGSLTSNGDGSYTYTPSTDFTGTDTFTYKVSDTAGATSSPATVTVTVKLVNTQPTTTPISGLNIPFGMAISADGSILYIPNYGGTTVSVINTADYTTRTTIAGFRKPAGLALSPDGSTLYVANRENTTVSVINTADNTTRATITGLMGPVALALSPDGSTLYVSNYDTNTVSVINTANNTTRTTITGLHAPGGLAISPDGSTLYVSNYDTNTVSVINTADNTTRTTITGFSNPYGVALTPDGSTLYVANAGDGTVRVIDTADNTTATPITGFGYPIWVAVTPDGSTLYVNDYDGNKVWFLNIEHAATSVAASGQT
ncbi:tandem-95 repeat protein [Mycobacterium sp. NBC_00419]|uniref:tandem-95 repeat protein n=1 Tax=Mycobacterium sp. NBC_00419 TaxID=2975989 RepID=UPI002E1CFDD3